MCYVCEEVRGSLVAKNWRSILVAIFPICLARFNRCSACTAASAAVAGGALSTSTLLCTSGCHAHRHCRWPSGPTWRHYQHNFLWSMPPVCRAEGNMVNIWGDRRHDCHTDDCLVYSPYIGDVHSPGKHPLCWVCSLCRRRRHTSCCCCTHYASTRSSCTAVWCGVCGLGKYYVSQKT